MAKQKEKTKFGSLYLRDKTWWAYFAPSKGDYRRESTGLIDLTEAKKWIEHRFKEECSNSKKDRKRVTRNFEDLAVKYCRDNKTRSANLSYIENLVNYFGKKEPTKIRPLHIKKFIHELTKSRLKLVKEPYAQNTINNYKRLLRAIIRYGTELDWYSLEQVARIKISNKGTVTRFREISNNELSKLLKHSPSHLKLSIHLAIFTGMRRGEILSLKWNQINLKDGFIYLSPQDVKEQYPRWIPLFPALKKKLRSQKINNEYVVNFKGNAIRDFKTSWRTAKKNAKITDLRFHDLRHYARRFFSRAGIKPEIVKSILGHHSMEMSMRYDSIYGEDFEQAKKFCTKFAQSKFGNILDI